MLSSESSRWKVAIVRRGFSAIEVTIVIGVVSVLSAIAMPAMVGVLDHMRVRAAATEIESLFGAARHVAIARDIGERGRSHRDDCFRRRSKVEAGHRNTGNLLPDRTLDRPDHRDLVGRHESKRIAGRRGAASAPNTMYVVFRLLRHIEVDD